MLVVLIQTLVKGLVMNQSITVTIKSVYGIDRIYPACDTSRLLAKLTGSKTFSDSHIQTIKELGYTVEVETKTL
jgi:hypothetical protein